MSSKALITGASAGIGAAYADRLAARGYDLILVARSEDRLDELAATLPTRTEVLPADLTEPADLERVASRLAEADLFVNNAGMSYSSLVADADPAQLQKLIDLNVSAFTRLAQAYAARRSGTLVNIASVMPILQLPGSATYTASKAYVLVFTQVLAAEHPDMRIQVVLPGAVATELWDRSGRPLSSLDPEIVMAAGDAVDAALAGLDAGEAVTILSLPDRADWDAFEAARLALAPNMSKREPAERYRVTARR
jgi:short-subunit dehydrogenase